MTNQQLIDQIVGELLGLASPKIQEARQPQIRGFIESTVNGDTIDSYLVINANLGKERKGALIYILTNVRLMKIEIDDKDMQSSSPSLNTIVNIDRKLVEGNRARIAIDFQTVQFGLGYSANNRKITEFFQKVDLSRAQGKP